MYLYYGALAFKIWMAVDCIRRGAESYWIWVVIFLPFGDWVYFFAVKIHDFRGKFSFDAPRSRSLEELRRRFNTTRSEENRLNLAEALTEAGHHQEAVEHYDAILRRDPAGHRARHGLARSLRSQGERQRAADVYRELLERNPNHDDFRAALEYAELTWDLGERDAALELLEELGKASGRFSHRLALAHYSNLHGDRQRAIEVLREALEHYEDSPKFVQRRDQRWSKQARQMLRQLEAGT